MATKYEIKKFIEKRQQEAKARIKSERDKNIDIAHQKFISEFSELIENVRIDLEATIKSLNRLIAAANDKGIEYQSTYYDNPRRYIETTLQKIKSSELIDYFNIPIIEQIKIKYEKLCDETAQEYGRLIAIIQNMTAKDGIKLLKELGFDVTELEAVKETTELTTTIDVKKLYLGGQS